MVDSTQKKPDQGEAKIYEPGGSRSIILLFLLSLAFFLNTADRFVLSPLLPFIKQDWQLSDQALGTLTGVISITIALLVIPTSIVIDRWSRKKMIAIMIFFWSLATLACAFAENYHQLLIARALTGIGEAGFASCSIAIIAASFPREARARATGVWNAFAPMGAAVGFLVGGYVGYQYGWRYAFGWVAIPGLMLAFAFLLTKDYKTVPLEVSDKIHSNKIGVLWRSTLGLFRTRSLVFVWLGFIMNFALNTPILAWLPTYLHRANGMDEKKAGLIAGVVMFMVVVGGPLGGYISDKWSKKRSAARMVVAGLASILSAVVLVLAFLLSKTSLFFPILILFGILCMCFFAPGAAVIQDVVHPGLRALAYGINVLGMHLFGASWSPWFVGVISDHWGLEKALFAPAAFGVIAGLFFLIGARGYEKDLKSAQKVVLLEA